MEFRKSYTLSLKDYMTYNLFSHRKQLVLMPVVFFALMTVAWVFIMLASSPDLITLIVVILLISLFAGLIALSNVLSLNRQAKRQYQSSHAMKTEFELIMDNNGVRESGSCGSTNAAWEHILRAVESQNAFYVHVSQLQAFVIPKRLLSAQEDALIRSLLTSHLEPKKCRIKR